MRFRFVLLCLWPIPGVAAARMAIDGLGPPLRSPAAMVVLAELLLAACASADYLFNALVRLRPPGRPGNPHAVPAIVAAVHFATICGLVADVFRDQWLVFEN